MNVQLSAKNAHIDKAVILVTVLNILLAVFSLAREMIMAFLFGTTEAADAYLLGYFIPDMVGNVITGMAIGLASIPFFSGQQKDVMEDMGSTVFWFIFMFMSVLLVVCFFMSGSIIGWTARGFTKESIDLTVLLFRVMLPLLFLYPVYFIASSALQANLSFFMPALGPVLLNMILVITLFLLFLSGVPARNGVVTLAWASLCGVFIMTLLQLMTLKVNGFKLKFIFLWDNMKEFLKYFLPVFLILMSNQSVLLVERILASNAGPGGVAGLNYAYKLAQFPVWTFTSAIGAVLFPLMARFSYESDSTNLHETLQKGIRLVLLINMPLAIILFLMRRQIVEILFQRGAFSDYSVGITVTILTGYALSIVWQSINYLFIRSLYATGKAREVLLITLFVSVFHIALDIYLVKIMGLTGIGYGAALGQMLYTFLLVIWYFHKSGLNPGNWLLFPCKIITACIPIILVILAGPQKPGSIISIISTVSLSMVVFVSLGIFLKIEEVCLAFKHFYNIFKR